MSDHTSAESRFALESFHFESWSAAAGIFVRLWHGICQLRKRAVVPGDRSPAREPLPMSTTPARFSLPSLAALAATIAVTWP